MNLVEHLSTPELRGWVLTVWATGLGVAVLCGTLSVVVVLKRLAFIGQGVTHAALGGVGLAAVIGVLIGSYEPTAGVIARSFQRSDDLGSFLLICAFCTAAALVIGRIGRDANRSDAAIGIVLVASMALGVLLQDLARHLNDAARLDSWEAVLFGSVLTPTKQSVALTWTVTGVVLMTLWWRRRPLFFWAFDEPAATAFGVSPRAMRNTLMVLLALAVVTAMQMVGVILATALLVLPGSTALRLSTRLGPVIGLSIATAVLGMSGGLVLTFELDWAPGPCIVVALTGLYAGAHLVPRRGG